MPEAGRRGARCRDGGEGRRQPLLALRALVPGLCLVVIPADKAFCEKPFSSFFGKCRDYYKSSVSDPALLLLLLSAKRCHFLTEAAACSGSSTLLENSLPYLTAWDDGKQVFCAACQWKDTLPLAAPLLRLVAACP